LAVKAAFTLDFVADRSRLWGVFMVLIKFKGNRDGSFSNRLICFMDRMMMKPIHIYHRVHFFDACPPTPQNASPISRVDTKHKPSLRSKTQRRHNSSVQYSSS
jgi:hypothetical protein